MFLSVYVTIDVVGVCLVFLVPRQVHIGGAQVNIVFYFLDKLKCSIAF